MLTAIQQKLLQMMKELDALCRENGIHYTLGGGSAIGAIRHRGFIPWDDDIDLYMTRDNWEKFKALGAAGKLPPHRVIESAETDLGYTNSIGRYVSTDSSSIHSHQIIYNDPAGHVLDVFVFDPIHIDNYKKFFEDLMLYSDLMDETKGYSSRFDMNLKKYPQALRKSESGHKAEVIGKLVDSFSHMDDPGWKHYIMEWGIAPFLFPASIFNGGYIRVPFEDTTVEIVRNFNEYLVWQYGDDWQYLPDHDGREGHDAIFSNDLPYDVVRNDYMPYIDADKVRAAYLRRKKRLLKANPLRRKTQREELDEKAQKYGDKFIKNLAYKALRSESYDMERMIEEHKFYDLAAVFEDYYKLQLGLEFAGRRDKHSSLRSYHYPTRIPLDTRTMEIAVEALLRTERMSKAKRLIDIYTGDFEENFGEKGLHTRKLDELNEEILRARALINDYSLLPEARKEVENDTEARQAVVDEMAVGLYERVCDFLEKFSTNSYIYRLKFKLLIEQHAEGMNVRKELRETIEALEDLCPEGTPAAGEVRKLKADLAGAGPEEYIKIAEATRNGSVLLEISDILAANGMALDTAEEEPEDVTLHKTPAPAFVNGPVEADSVQKKLYNMARDIYKGAADKDDRLKEEAWQIACRTRDRVELLEYYSGRLDLLEELRDKGDWDELRKEMQPHEEAVLRNLEAGLGLSVHPLLTDIQYEIFRDDGRENFIEIIESLIPEAHRIPIGYTAEDIEKYKKPEEEPVPEEEAEEAVTEETEEIIEEENGQEE